MNIYVSGLLVVAALSLVGNLLQFRHAKKLRKVPQPTYEASELFRRLMAGGAMIKVTVLDPGAFFMRSPKDVA